MRSRFIGKWGKALSRIKRLFHRPKAQPVIQETVAATPTPIISPPVETQAPPSSRSPSVPAIPSRPQRLWNVGLDFGTAYTKCIVRNLATEEAFLVPLCGDEYLFPTTVFCGCNWMWLHGDEPKEQTLAKISHLKMALAEVSAERPTGMWVEDFMRATQASDINSMRGNIEALTVYFLARVIQRARSFIITKTPDFSEKAGDRLMVNMAVPVAHAQEVQISKSFQRCLNLAFLLAQEGDLSRHSTEEIQSLLAKIGEPPKHNIGCYLYPEVSANVQSYIRSHGVEGLYLFLDIGAGTVDLSIFIYYPHEDNDRPLSYTSAGVIPLGSSQIEIRAARRLNGSRQQTIAELQEIVRQIKEGRGQGDAIISQEIRLIENELETEMFNRAAPILKYGKDRIILHQWQSLKMLIGGGGAATPLYRKAVNRWFEQVNFFVPEVRPMPIPNDLRWPSSIPESRHERLFRRFSVAYGLSFDRANLDDHRFPEEMPPLPTEPDTPPERPQAPTKDEC